MRMTNEEFQAEVFRRSNVYLQQKRQNRRRFFYGAAAFACCFVIAAGGLALRSRMNGDQTAFPGFLDNATASETIAESSEEYREEESSEAAEAASEAESAEAWDGASLNAKSDQYKGDAEFAGDEMQTDNLTADEYLRALNLNPLPKTLGQLHLNQIPSDMRFHLDEYTTYDEGCYSFTYSDGNGKPALQIEMRRKQDFELEFEPDIYPAHTEEELEFPTRACFVSGEAQFWVIAADYDTNDTEQIRALAQELYDALRSDEIHDLTAEEYFRALGINPLPETLGGCTLQAETEMHDVGFYNRFTYLNADGEPEMYVDICDSKGWATSDGVYLWTSAGEPTTAEFSAGKAKVELKAAQLAEGDAAKIEELAEELMHTLRKE